MVVVVVLFLVVDQYMFLAYAKTAAVEGKLCMRD